MVYRKGAQSPDFLCGVCGTTCCLEENDVVYSCMSYTHFSEIVVQGHDAAGVLHKEVRRCGAAVFLVSGTRC